MTTPRPPRRPTPARRVPKVAGHTPAKAVPESAATPEKSVTPPVPKAPEKKVPEKKAPEKKAPEKAPEPAAASATVEPAGAPESDEWTSADTATPVETSGETPTDSAPAESTPAETTPAETTQADTTPAETTPAEPTAAASPRGKRPPAVKVSTIKPQRASAATAGASASATDTAGDEKKRRLRIAAPGWRAVSIVAAIAVVFGIVAAVSAAKPGVSLSSNQAFVDSGVTSEVTSQAKSRICSVFAVNYAKMDQWQATAAANVTGEAAQRFSQYNTAVRQALEQTGLTAGGVDCRVDSVGVKSIENGNALLIVNLIISQTQDQQAAGSGTKRYQVSMTQVNNRWLISNFADF